jgi:hypothetical protein
MSAPLHIAELFRRKREARQLDAAPKSVATLAAEKAKDAFAHAQLLKEADAACAANSDAPEILDGTRPLFFEIRPSRVGVVEVFYSRRQSFTPKKILGELKHEDLTHALLKLLANVQPAEIDIYDALDNEGIA